MSIEYNFIKCMLQQGDMGGNLLYLIELCPLHLVICRIVMHKEEKILPFTVLCFKFLNKSKDDCQPMTKCSILLDIL